MKTKLLVVILIIWTVMLLSQDTRDPLFEEVEITLNNDVAKSADILCYRNFSQTVEHYNTATELEQNNGTAGEIRAELETSISLLTKMNENLERNSQIFNSVIDARNNALTSGAEKYAAYYWELSENEFKESVDDLNDGDLDDVTKNIPSLKKNYEIAENYGIKASSLLFRWNPLINAEKNIGNILAPDLYSDGIEKLYAALDYISSGDDEESINDAVFEAGKSFDSASNNSLKFIKTYPDLIKARADAQNAGAENYAVAAWEGAEELLTETVSSFNDEDIEDADVSAESAKYKYFAVKHTAVKNHFLYAAKEQVALAGQEDAEEYAPETFDSSKLHLGLVTDIIDNKSQDSEKIRNLAEKAFVEAHNARLITRKLKKIDSGDQTWENLIIEWNILNKLKSSESSQPEKINASVVEDTTMSAAIKLFSQAVSDGAEEYAPKTFKKSNTLFELAKNIRKNGNYTPDELKSLAEKAAAAAQKSIDIAAIVKPIMLESMTGEEVILSWNILPKDYKLAYLPSWKSDNIKSEIPKEKKIAEIPAEPTGTNLSNIDEIFSAGDAEIRESENGKIIRLRNFSFSPMGTVLNDKDKLLLNKIIEAIKLFPNSNVKITGYTDNVGIKSVNQKLSLKRAKSVKKYIIDNSDIAPYRLIAEGRGETQPVADNHTYEGRKKNRRIEIEIIKER